MKILKNANKWRNNIDKKKTKIKDCPISLQNQKLRTAKYNFKYFQLQKETKQEEQKVNEVAQSYFQLCQESDELSGENEKL